MSTVHIEVSPNGRDGKVVIDGHDVHRAVQGFTVRHQAGHRVTVELDLAAHDLTTFGSEHAEVLIDPSAMRLLERAGWTPPPGVKSLLERKPDGCPCDWIETWEAPDGQMVEEDDEGAVKRSLLGRTVPTCPVHGVNARRSNG